MASKLVERVVYCERIGAFLVKLMVTGKLFVGLDERRMVQRDWYKNPATRQPWIPKRSNFIALLSQAIKDGAYDDLVVNTA